MNNTDLHVRRGAYLPHWTKEGAIYHVRFRLADSLPQEKIHALKEEREELHKKMQKGEKELTKEERKHINHLFSRKIDDLLDAGYGSCLLQRDEVVKMVAETLSIFEGERYALYAWCIMPNHVHVVVQPCTEKYSLRKIIHSWKSYTANEANKILGKRGAFWQVESFDHILRNQEHLERAIEYVWQNPEKAGLPNWKWRWRIEQSS